MTQYKGNHDPDYDELVPSTPIVINGNMFDPATCVHTLEQDPTAQIEHTCVHDWRVYWGQQKRVV